MISAAFKKPGRECGVTIIEVLASALLIFLGLGGIFAMNTQSLEILRSTRLLANGSQILQERVETLRSLPWPEVANSQAVSNTVYSAPAPSAAELSKADLVETIIFSVPSTPGQPSPDNNTFVIRRKNGAVRVLQAGDFTSQPLLLVDMTVSWQDRSSTKQRQLRTIICRDGLTRSGIFGSAFGRPATIASGKPGQ
jgi:Tfp pilus assembly protein PilV